MNPELQTPNPKALSLLNEPRKLSESSASLTQAHRKDPSTNSVNSSLGLGFKVTLDRLSIYWQAVVSEQLVITPGCCEVVRPREELDLQLLC